MPSRLAVLSIWGRSRGWEVAMLRFIALAIVSTGLAWGAQIDYRVVQSPINGKLIDDVADIPVTSGHDRVLGVDGDADMGIDSDGCRHSSGLSEYDHYIVTCPYSYFSAMAIEWGKNGRFNERLSPEFKQWLLSADGFHTEWVTDKQKKYTLAQKQARLTGKPLEPIQDWQIPQNTIPIEDKYRYALICYNKRGANDKVLGKLALTGSWAIRARLNKPLINPQLRPGVEEVNERIERLVKGGEEFDFDTFYEAYQKIFNSGRLTDEGYMTAGLVYFGFSLRQGDLEESIKILDKLEARYDGDEEMHKVFRSLVRARRTAIRDYVGFMDTSVKYFTSALANEEFYRPQIPQIMLVVAEMYRRMGNPQRAYDWYLALANLEESNPRLRDQIRESGSQPNMSAGVGVMLGWQADEAMAMLDKAQVVHPGTIAGPDSRLLNAIVVEGLGTLSYVNPLWQPRSDGNQLQTSKILLDTGLAVLDYTDKLGEWPSELGELWMSGVMPDRNLYNRFHCMATGKPLLYTAIGGPLSSLSRNKVIVATSAPVPTNQGLVYGAFLAGLNVVWSKTPLKPGDLHEP